MIPTTMILLFLSLQASIPDASVQDLWHVGKGLAPGDSFTYNICENARRSLHDYGGCYTLRMDFYEKLLSRDNAVWIVQAGISGHNNTDHHVFLMDANTLDISTDHAASKFADSVKNTVFYMAQFSHGMAPQSLRVGSSWGDASQSTIFETEPVVSHHDTVELDGRSVDVSVIRYGLYAPSHTVISREVPFPISAISYSQVPSVRDPVILSAFELIEYSPGGDDDFTIDHPIQVNNTHR